MRWGIREFLLRLRVVGVPSFKRAKYRGNQIWMVAAMLAIGGCSYNQYGVVFVSREPINGGISEVFRAPGLHLENTPEEVSLSAGYLRKHELLESTARLKDERPDSNVPMIVNRTVVGLQFRLRSLIPGITIGWRSELVSYFPRSETTRVIDFSPFGLSAANSCIGEASCMDGLSLPRF